MGSIAEAPPTQESTNYLKTGDPEEFSPDKWTSGILPERGPASGLNVLIVGAGPAGLMTALECWRKGHNIAGILERSDGPSYAGAFRLDSSTPYFTLS